MAIYDVLKSEEPKKRSMIASVYVYIRSNSSKEGLIALDKKDLMSFYGMSGLDVDYALSVLTKHGIITKNNGDYLFQTKGGSATSYVNVRNIYQDVFPSGKLIENDNCLQLLQQYIDSDKRRAVLLKECLHYWRNQGYKSDNIAGIYNVFTARLDEFDQKTNLSQEKKDIIERMRENIPNAEYQRLAVRLSQVIALLGVNNE